MLLLLLVLVFQCCSVFSQTQTSGNQFISYHIYGNGQTNSACYYYEPASNWAGYVTANTFGLPCGTCVLMTSVATGKYIYVTAIDIGGRGFDLNFPAFCELCCAEGGFVSGGCNINWQVVDVSLCTNWNAGKTQPNCNPCPTGTICGNFNPNANAGVNWSTYCPQEVDLGGISMTRCQISMDGCSCPGGSSNPPPVAPPTNPPTAPPVAPPVTPPTGSSSGGKGTTATRCGANWSDANTGCYTDCVDNSACTTDKRVLQVYL